ncbi:MAG: transcription elongation factor GreA [bacterium]
MIKKILLTPEGLKEKEQERNNLKTTRVEAVKELQTARNMGDLSENGAYKAARFRLSGIDRRLCYIEGVLKRVVVVEKRTDGWVGIGSHIMVNDGVTDLELTVVDSHESDFMKGKISLYSPIGRALIGRKAGEKVEVITIKGKVSYTVIQVQ